MMDLGRARRASDDQLAQALAFGDAGHPLGDTIEVGPQHQGLGRVNAEPVRSHDANVAPAG